MSQSFNNYLANSHVYSSIILSDIKVEIFVIHFHVTAFRKLPFETVKQIARNVKAKTVHAHLTDQSTLHHLFQILPTNR